MKTVLEIFIIGVTVIAFACLSVVGIVSSIHLFIHIADVMGWNCVLRFILASFDLIISIFIIFVLGWIVQESDKND